MVTRRSIRVLIATRAQELSAVWVSVTELVRRFVGDDLSENMLKVRISKGYIGSLC